MSREPRKRSLTIAGHRTSISLEQAFWEALREVAGSQGRSIAALVTEIDSNRTDMGLSCAIRTHLLDYYRDRTPRPEASETGIQSRRI